PRRPRPRVARPGPRRSGACAPVREATARTAFESARARSRPARAARSRGRRRRTRRSPAAPSRAAPSAGRSRPRPPPSPRASPATGAPRAAEPLANAEEHLELVLAPLEPVLGDELSPLVLEPVVVGRDPHVAPELEQLLERLDEVRPHGVEVAVRDLRGLDVDALAEPDVRPQLGEVVDVPDRPPHVGLEHDPDVVVTGRAEVAVDAQRVVRRGRVLHVDADEVPP